MKSSASEPGLFGEGKLGFVRIEGIFGILLSVLLICLILNVKYSSFDQLNGCDLFFYATLNSVLHFYDAWQ